MYWNFKLLLLLMYGLVFKYIVFSFLGNLLKYFLRVLWSLSFLECVDTFYNYIITELINFIIHCAFSNPEENC